MPSTLSVQGVSKRLNIVARQARARKAREAVRVRLRAGDTLSAVEMDPGDVVEFTLRSGAVRVMELLDTSAAILHTNLAQPKVARGRGATVYHFTCRVRIDGHEMLMERYVGCQECYYEPYVINGMRVWFDAVSDIFDFLNESHGACAPAKRARFALADMTARICPEELKAWCPLDGRTLKIEDAYRGDDCWLGAYLGADAHGGLDINHPRGTPIWAPIAFDDHYLFESVAAGDNNNRWRGVRTWPNGDVWALQVHHVTHLLVPEHLPLPAGMLVAEGAGASTGLYEHSHFVFKVKPAGEEREILLDPWILFWQMFEDRNARWGAIRAAIRPLERARVGEPVRFSSEGSRPGPNGGALQFSWTFGDGGASCEAHPTHTYLKPGVYPVTLTVEDGADRAQFTQHITVDGPAEALVDGIDSAGSEVGNSGRNSGERGGVPGLVLEAPDEISFRRRPVWAMDVYGAPVRRLPHTLEFTARPTRPVPAAKVVRAVNAGAGVLPALKPPEGQYLRPVWPAWAEAPVRRGLEGVDAPRAPIVHPALSDRWLSIDLEGSGNDQRLVVRVDASGLPPGEYVAQVRVEAPGAVNGRQDFRVRLRVPSQGPVSRWLGKRRNEHVIVDESDLECEATPYFWVGHRVRTGDPPGFLGYHLFNGKRPRPGEFVRFTPDLPAGVHRVRLSDETPFPPDASFNVRVRSAEGDVVLRVEPAKDRTVGIFRFEEGTDGFVEILAEGSHGQVLADAVIFEPVES